MEKTDDIDTNRPSFMFSPLVLPAGSLQFENGTLYQHFQHGRTNFGIPETQVRLGLTKRTEFEMFVPNFVLNHQEHTIARAGGASDLNEVGIKHQFPSIRNFQITFIGALNIPTGSVTISGPGVQPVFRFPWAYPMGKWSIMGQQSLLLINSGRDLLYEPDFMLDRFLTPRLSVFFEYASFLAQRAPGISIANFGVEWKISRHQQLDTRWGCGLSKSSPAAFVGAGYSFRFDGLPWGGSGKK